ncbi:MAG: prepilin-type N-terminal cleavage/methylation domain-containing protein [Acidobacteria bacterium]|nr:prepilin-type N-terminal cleavage/methylation domain-containing protein [Acidobacteriota bacterium]
MNKNRKGFTLIELLIVVAIIGIIVAIAIPNLLNAIQRAKQKKTMGDMRSIGTAAESYAVDYNRYPAAAASIAGTPSAAITATVTNSLEPTYIKKLPTLDGWSSPLLYGVFLNNSEYVIFSAGRNGATSAYSGGPTTDFNADIVFTNGQFVQYPEGAQN